MEYPSVTDSRRKIWNWVRNAHWAATTTKPWSQMNKTSLCVCSLQFNPTERRRNFPLPVLIYAIPYDLSFSYYSLHSNKNQEVILPHPVKGFSIMAGRFWNYIKQAVQVIENISYFVWKAHVCQLFMKSKIVKVSSAGLQTALAWILAIQFSVGLTNVFF